MHRVLNTAAPSLALALALAATAATPSALASKRAVRCAGRSAFAGTRLLPVSGGAGRLAQDNRIRVFGRDTGQDEQGDTETTLSVCTRPNGAPHALVTGVTIDNETGEYPADSEIIGVGVGGAFAAGWVRTGAQDVTVCEKYMQPSCGSPNGYIRLVDGRSGAGVTLATADTATGRPATPVVSGAGAVAWLDGPPGSPIHLHAARVTSGGHGRLRASPAVIDTGNISAASIRLAGFTLFWTKDSQQHALVLPPPTGS